MLAGSPVLCAQTGAPIRLGILAGGNPRSAPFYVAFEKRLAELGYVEGRNLTIDFRWAAGDYDKLPAFMAELVRARCDLIFTSGPEAPIRAAKDGAGAIPVVMVAIDFDPVATGIVSSLRRPGGKVTGVSVQQLDLTAKRLELLRELVPQLKRVAVFADRNTRDQLRVAQDNARRLALSLQPVELGVPPDYETAFRTLRAGSAEALLMLMTPVLFRDREAVAALTREHRLPSIFGLAEYPEAGGLLSYGINISEEYRRGADYVDKVLKGANPGDLPVEQPTRFELVINLKTAKALGIKVPQTVLLRADRIIE